MVTGAMRHALVEDAGSVQPAESALELTLLMPCLNEAETLETCIRKAQGFLERSGLSGEVVVADNGSTDGSRELARRLGARVVEVPTRGYGAALHAGSLSARGRFIIMGDSDDSYDFSELDAFVKKLREGYDLVMGNRFQGGILPGAMPWKNRYIGNPVLSGLGRLFFRCPVGDFHCGLRGYSREAFRRMDLRTTGMEFASEMVIKATILGMKIHEVPTRLHKDGRSRPPHLRPWRDGWRHLRFMLLYNPQGVFLYPGLGLMALGLGLALWLLPGPRWVGGTRLDVHTLMYAATAFLMGFQGVMFFAFTRVLAVAEGLVPGNTMLDRIFSAISLEAGLVAGALLLAAGVGGTAYSLGAWSQTGFGDLEPSRMLRAVIPSVVAVTLGCEVLLSSFFLSMMGLRVRLREPGEEDPPSAGSIRWS